MIRNNVLFVKITVLGHLACGVVILPRNPIWSDNSTSQKKK